ncbi:putative MFS family arabinose efflux permease [Geodermatophilus bullaregiensis]|uniref:MFS transporter n=1 Tax=Geodermatophilus bullaregiensis TaxID=1564160 RepID=UPI001959377D|nr:MFS transporter [Geodermatophilus bullaregiensis]MBM7808849.1 putative MFS family arabinose efflux permease [Geodermatophilus bullaregiensis]
MEVPRMEQVERRAGSLVAAGTGVIAVTYGLVRFGYGLHLPAFTAEFALPGTVAGAVAAGSFAGYCAAALLAQWLVSRGRPRLTLWTACALATVGALGTAAAWSATSLAVGVVVAGSAAGAASPALVAAVAATVRAPAADRAQAVVNSGTGGGVVVGGLLAAALSGQWRLLWVGFAVAAVVVTWWADRRTTWPTGPAAPRADASRLRTDLAALRPSLVAALLAGAGSAAVWTFGRDLLATTGGLPAVTTALLWSVLGGAGILGAASGDLVHRLGPRRAWAATAVVMAAATAVLVVLPGLVLPAAVALAAFGGSYVAMSGVLIVCATRVTPHRAAGSTAILFVALTAGQALGAAALGALADVTSLATGFLGAAALVLLSTVAAARQSGHPVAAPAGASRRTIRVR